MGITQVLFDCNPLYTIETMSYCTVGHVPRESFSEFVTVFPEVKVALRDQVLQNPFDGEREQFVKLCKTTVDYFKDTDEDMLR